MASHQHPTLSVCERLDLLLIRTPLLFTKIVLGTLATHPFRRKLGWAWKRTLGTVFIHSRGILSWRQRRAGFPTTGEAVAEVCAAKTLTHHPEPLDCGATLPSATLHYIKLTDAPVSPRVVLYLHGGGYTNPLSARGQLPAILDVARAGRATHLVVLEYTLAPALRYPGQLAQASAALNVLLASHTPADIVLAGDSAGGNLALGLLAHIKAPHADARVPAIDLKGGAFAGVLLISPWVAMPTSAPSYVAFDGIDIIDPNKMVDYVARFAPPTSPREVYADPVVERSGFWRSVPASKVLITGGTHECFVDDIKELAQLMGAKPFVLGRGRDIKVGLALAENETHVQLAIDTALGVGVCESQKIAMEWMSTL